MSRSRKRSDQVREDDGLADLFNAQRLAVRGTGNGVRMQRSVWEHLVMTGDSAFLAGRSFGVEPVSGFDRPGWTFDRFGQSRTMLPDGRVICIAGEHEDHYDPDFFIYNDVIVVRPEGCAIEIYGYSPDAFPPTDFHTATLVNDAIYVIGGLGYARPRGGTETPVFRLDLASYRIDRVELEPGGSPGWLYDHRAERTPDGTGIRVAGGTVISRDESGRECSEPNARTFRLDLARGRWVADAGEVPALANGIDPRDAGFEPLDSPYAARKFRDAIGRAVGPTHPLFAKDAWWPIGKRDALRWDVLLQSRDGSGRLAICDGPTYSGRQPDDEVRVRLFDDVGGVAAVVTD